MTRAAVTRLNDGRRYLKAMRYEYGGHGCFSGTPPAPLRPLTEAERRALLLVLVSEQGRPLDRAAARLGVPLDRAAAWLAEAAQRERSKETDQSRGSAAEGKVRP